LIPYQVLSSGLSTHEAQRLAHLVGVSHDVGKATKYFQEYIAGRTVLPQLRYHSLLSSLYAYYAACQLGFEMGKIVPICAQMIVQSHHGALKSPIAAASKLYGSKDLLRKQASVIQNIDELDSCLEEMRMPSFNGFHSKIDNLVMDLAKAVPVAVHEQRNKFGNSFFPFFMTNLFLSVLVDADRMDAAQLPFPKREVVRAKDVEAYVRLISEHAKKLKDIDENIIEGRDLLFETLSKEASTISLDSKILSITAPTGYGKTLAGIHFAIKLRERLSSHGLNPRIIYVAPLLSILDQNAEVIRRSLGIQLDQSNLLLIHHHLAEMNYSLTEESEESFTTLNSELLIEGWNAEIIITTFIQFFYSILGNRASQLRKLHNMTGSIVLLDEVQAIPHEYWGLIREVIGFLSEYFNIYFILMTATQPLIFHSNEIHELVKKFTDEYQKPRVTFKIKINREIPIDKFIKEVMKIIYSKPHSSKLIVLNTVKSAMEIYQAIEAPIEKYYLSANIVPKQRHEILRVVMDVLKERRPIVLVSTQVVEAGVDIDFDMAIRDIGPVDSIIQVAGRCNRNGSRDSKNSPVYIYNITDSNGRKLGRQIYGPYLIEKTMEVLTKPGTRIPPDHLSIDYYKAVTSGTSELESEKLLNFIRDLDYGGIDDFTLVDEQGYVSVYIELDQEAEHVWHSYEGLLDMQGLQAKEEFLKLRKFFYNYVINVPKDDIADLHAMKGFYHVSRDDLHKFYDFETGFRR